MEIKIENVEFGNGVKIKNIVIDKEILSIVGRNNSGKSLLLNVLGGTNFKFLGKIYVDGNLISESKGKRQKGLTKKISYLKQDYFDDLICSRVLDYINSTAKKYSIETLDSLMRSFDLDEEVLNKSCLDLNIEETKKVLLISKILMDSSIILLDDPTLGLNKKSIFSLIKILKDAKRRGKTIIISSNDSEFLFNVSDSFLVIDTNKTYKELNKYNLFSNVRLLNRLNLKMPNVLSFKIITNRKKKIKLLYRDNVNDLLKEIYRHV